MRAGGRWRRVWLAPTVGANGTRWAPPGPAAPPIDRSIGHNGAPVPDLLRAAAIQLTATADRARNLDTADRLVRAAAADGAQLVLLPEKWSVFGNAEALREGAEPLDGPALSWARSTAAELGIDLVAGSVAEKAAPESADQRNGNTSVHVGPDGTDRATYRKIHLFDVEVGGTVYRESDTDRPGDEVVTTDVAGHTTGLTVCYDLRFPGLYEALSRRGAEIILIPAAFTAKTTVAHWEILLRARAIEAQAFVIAANQTGRHTAEMQSGGRSMIVDPWGEILAEASTDAETFITADLDFDRLAEVRSRIPALTARLDKGYS